MTRYIAALTVFMLAAPCILPNVVEMNVMLANVVWAACWGVVGGFHLGRRFQGR